MVDRFADFAGGLEAPAGHGFVIAPHDSNELAELTRALYVGGAGRVSVVLQSGAAIDFESVPAGAVLPIRVRMVKTTTTATALLGLV